LQERLFYYIIIVAHLAKPKTLQLDKALSEEEEALVEAMVRRAL
jgi:hypothetical protein